MLKAQTIFNRVVDHLLKQGTKSTDGRSCLYRGPEGRKCAIGALIPDDLYSPDMEGRSIIGVVERFPNIDRILGGEAPLANKLQCVHDNYEPHHWPHRLAIVANEFGLTQPSRLRKALEA